MELCSMLPVTTVVFNKLFMLREGMVVFPCCCAALTALAISCGRALWIDAVISVDMVLPSYWVTETTGGLLLDV
eukprot:4409452-Ditylum_brightwellii.AAC.1